MSHLPLSFMNRLIKTESAVFSLLDSVFPDDPLFRLKTYIPVYSTSLDKGLSTRKPIG